MMDKVQVSLVDDVFDYQSKNSLSTTSNSALKELRMS